MKKQLLKSALLAMAGVGLLAGGAMALPSEWAVIDTDLTGNAIKQHDFGYYISADATRTDWVILWEAGNNWWDPSLFSGNIQLENATGIFSSIAFERVGDYYNITADNDAVTFWSLTSNGYDGIGFTITQTAAPSYVGFDLNYDSKAMDPNYIYLGDKGVTVASLAGDEDFAFAAPVPVPEPATMLLFGTGLAGLAAVARRRKTQA